ncbi:MAG: hypothetical protein WBC71_11585 [Salaquimonas sp.]
MPAHAAIPVPDFFRRSQSAQNVMAKSDADKIIAYLNRSIAGIEKRTVTLQDIQTQIRVPIGIAEIDSILSSSRQTTAAQGIIANALHEIRVERGLEAANGAGFALCMGLTIARALLRKQTGKTAHLGIKPLAPVFWIADDFTRSEYGDFYGPGLKAYGIAPENLIRIHPKNREETLWVAGEIAATRGAASFCLIEIRGHPKEFDLTTTRRLMLRAQASGTPIILLRQSGQEEASAAATRWHVSPASSCNTGRNARNKIGKHQTHPLMHQFIGPPAFTVHLEKCRGANANQMTPWKIEWNPHDQCFALLAKPSRSPSRHNGSDHQARAKTHA